ncbi:MAG: ABC transporter permease subunit [Actinomycetota bacterium]
MIAEYQKLIAHRAPWIATGVLLVGMLAAPVVLTFYTPDDPTVYGNVNPAIFSLLGPLVAAIFGSWILGTEFRQGTVKRLLATDPRRGRVLARKAVAGGGILATILATTGLVGYGASWIVAEMNDAAFAFDGRMMLAGGLFGMGAAAAGFGLSAVTKSDAFAAIGTVGMVMVLDPLLSLVPKVGDYTFGATLGQITDRIAGTVSEFSATNLSTTTAAVVASLWIIGFVGAGSALFARRDV